LPTGLIHTAWNSDETMRGALGYTTGAVVRTTGQMQRVPGTNTVYFSSGAGGIYRVTDGGAWGVVGRQ
ncbi:MAG: hypothetical protein JXQ72_08930, partial [Anaerolineae bacterium]|nr:hypothetical protein [Anaerolineae bacterium]